jgi:hypothetical protein
MMRSVLESELKLKILLVEYIRRIRTYSSDPRNFDWRIYEEHKDEIQKMCNEDRAVYEYGIVLLTNKLRI